MRCAVLNCKENENGYCTCSSYVEIDETGSCTEMFILTKENTDDNKINL